MFQLSNLGQFVKRYYEYFILGFLIAFLIASNVVWLQYDNSLVENRDSTIFLSRMVDFIKKTKLPNFDLVDSLGEMSLDGRPVLVQVLGIPFILLFGYSMDAYTYVNFLFCILLVIATYNIGKEAKDRNAGLLAAVLVSFYPSTVRLSNIPLNNFAIIACAALTVWFLLRFMKNHSIKDAWLINLSLVIGFWIHPAFLWGVSIPAALLQLYLVFFGAYPKWISQPKELSSWVFAKLRQPFFLYGVLPSALVSIGAILNWYLRFGLPLLDSISAVSASIPDGGKVFFGPSYQGVPYPFWFIVSSGLALSTVLAVLFWFSLVVVNVKRQPQTLILTFIFVSMYFTHNMLLGLSWRYFSQALPIIAALTGFWIVSIRNKFVSTLLAIVCVVVSVFNFVTVSWGVSPVSKPVAVALGMHSNSGGFCRPSYALYCSDPPNPEEWPTRKMLSLVFDDPKCNEGNCRLLVITPNLDYCQAFPLSAAIDFPDTKLKITCILFFLGAWKSDISTGTEYYDIPSLLESDYIIFTLRKPYPGIDRLYNPEWLLTTDNFFNTPPALFSEAHRIVAEYSLPGALRKAVLYKRIQPLTLEEAEQAVSALALPDGGKFRTLELFLRLSKKEEDVNKWLAAYKDVLLHSQKPGLFLFQISILAGVGDYYYSSGQMNFAITTYEQVLEMNPDNLPVQLNLAKIYVGLDDFKDAIPHLSEIARLQPIALRYTNLGDAYRNYGDYENAIASYQKALRIDSKDVRAHLGLALSYAAKHQFDKARQEFEQVIEMAPGSDNARKAQKWLEENKNNQ
jgi:tetratricopeptide (TPR) repeat protein